jgi:DNA polymerase
MQQKNEMIDKAEAIKGIYKQIESDDKTQSLSGVGKTIVYPGGNPYAGLMLIGEGPGTQEELKQHPFVGRAGMFLKETLENLGFNMEQDFYITNVVKHRAFKITESGEKTNKPPTAQQINVERKYLLQEIEVIMPGLAVALGAIASQWFFGKGFSLTKSHGTFLSWHEINILPTFHPSAVLRALGTQNGKERRSEFINDLKHIRELYP